MIFGLVRDWDWWLNQLFLFENSQIEISPRQCYINTFQSYSKVQVELKMPPIPGKTMFLWKFLFSFHMEHFILTPLSRTLRIVGKQEKRKINFPLIDCLLHQLLKFLLSFVTFLAVIQSGVCASAKLVLVCHSSQPHRNEQEICRLPWAISSPQDKTGWNGTIFLTLLRRLSPRVLWRISYE